MSEAQQKEVEEKERLRKEAEAMRTASILSAVGLSSATCVPCGCCYFAPSHVTSVVLLEGRGVGLSCCCVLYHFGAAPALSLYCITHPPPFFSLFVFCPCVCVCHYFVCVCVCVVLCVCVCV